MSQVPVPTTGRVQLALNVTDVDRAVEFYSKVFGVEPAKRRPGYANFAIAEPPLKLVLIEGDDGGTLNHLGVEVIDTPAVNEATKAFVGTGLTTFEEQGVEIADHLGSEASVRAEVQLGGGDGEIVRCCRRWRHQMQHEQGRQCGPAATIAAPEMK